MTAARGRARPWATAARPAVPWARRVLRHALRDWQVQSVADPAALLVSELVTNAVEASAGRTGRDHGKLPMIGLAIRLTAASLVLEVWDASHLRPVPKEADTAADHGRGLVLVDALAGSWGHRAAHGGKVVWCELGLDYGESAMTRRPATNTRTAVSKREPATVILAVCSEEEYAQRTAKSDEARDYYVAGYLTG
jgi:hypothetical protein